MTSHTLSRKQFEDHYIQDLYSSMLNFKSERANFFTTFMDANVEKDMNAFKS